MRTPNRIKHRRAEDDANSVKNGRVGDVCKGFHHSILDAFISAIYDQKTFDKKRRNVHHRNHIRIHRRDVRNNIEEDLSFRLCASTIEHVTQERSNENGGMMVLDSAKVEWNSRNTWNTFVFLCSRIG